jgi:hypothetical protein
VRVVGVGVGVGGSTVGVVCGVVLDPRFKVAVTVIYESQLESQCTHILWVGSSTCVGRREIYRYGCGLGDAGAV